MDSPVEDAEDSSSAESEWVAPTGDARLCIEKDEKGFKVDASAPPEHACRLLGVVVDAMVAAGALFAPMVTLKAVPEDLPHWATIALIGAQLVILILVGANSFFTNTRVRKTV